MSPSLKKERNLYSREKRSENTFASELFNAPMVQSLKKYRERDTERINIQEKEDQILISQVNSINYSMFRPFENCSERNFIFERKYWSFNKKKFKSIPTKYLMFLCFRQLKESDWYKTHYKKTNE